MIDILTMLLAQLSAFYLLTKAIISSFAIPTINISTLSALIKNATQRILSLSDPESTKNGSSEASTAATTPRATKVMIPSPQTHTLPKPHIISKRGTMTKKSRCNMMSPNINDMPMPGIQCATM